MYKADQIKAANGEGKSVLVTSSVAVLYMYIHTCMHAYTPYMLYQHDRSSLSDLLAVLFIPTVYVLYSTYINHAWYCVYCIHRICWTDLQARIRKLSNEDDNGDEVDQILKEAMDHKFLKAPFLRSLAALENLDLSVPVTPKPPRRLSCFLEPIPTQFLADSTEVCRQPGRLLYAERR